jgi:2-polyprenyl-3-methyl-5-hydroxy-6-metoxy-1,4-benzoquinol methylase
MMTAVLLVALLQVQHQQHPPRSAAEYAKVLENPARDAWQKPHEVMQALALRSDEVVADIGAGSGYFARRMAHHAAKVFAVDIDAKLLEMIKANAPANVETVPATHDDPKLAEGSVDTIFICDVLHHISNRPAYYAKLGKALKAGGRIVIIDFYKRELPVGPPVSMKLSEDEVKAELEAAGFVRKKSHEFLPHQYFLEFVRR